MPRKMSKNAELVLILSKSACVNLDKSIGFNPRLVISSLFFLDVIKAMSRPKIG
jgi:hypothetical protein